MRIALHSGKHSNAVCCVQGHFVVRVFCFRFLEHSLSVSDCETQVLSCSALLKYVARFVFGLTLWVFQSQQRTWAQKQWTAHTGEHRTK